MGFARRIVRKSVRKATPRTVRKAMHPVRTATNAITPRPIKKASRAIYTVTNPLGAAENALIGAALYPGRGSRRSRSPAGSRSVASRPFAAGPSPTETRRAEGLASQDALSNLMTMQREKFAVSSHPQIGPPALLDPTPFMRTDWLIRRKEVKLWDRKGRREIRTLIANTAQAHVRRQHQWALRAIARQQAEADAWWAALQRGNGPELCSVLLAAFSDNPAPVTVLEAEADHGVFLLHLPQISVLPSRKPHVTPGGKVSTKAWTKTELNQVYVELLGGHLLATLREAWAVGPSLRLLRVIGLRGTTATQPEFLFDIHCERSSNWASDVAGYRALEGTDGGLRRAGRTREVTAWSPDKQPPELVQWLIQTSPALSMPIWNQPIVDVTDPEPVYRGSPPRLTTHRTPSLIIADPAPPPALAAQQRASGAGTQSTRRPARIPAWAAVLVSFFVAGLGSVLNRRPEGVGIFLGYLACLIALIFVTGLAAGLALLGLTGFWIWGLVDARSSGTCRGQT